MDEPTRKRTTFSFDAGKKLLASKGRLPDLNKLNPVVRESPAPHKVHDQCCGPARLIGIDIETHVLIPKSASCLWRTDDFGLWTGVSEEGLSSLRMIQLG